jgi:hypothetical protein
MKIGIIFIIIKSFDLANILPKIKLKSFVVDLRHVLATCKTTLLCVSSLEIGTFF